jgi:hypothetical protein
MIVSDEGFIVILSLLMTGMAYWAFKRLPDERWQFLASVPVMKDASGRWHGFNFTYYGLLTANAVIFGVAILIILLGALGVPVSVALGLIVAVLLVCLPAARWVAQLVEGKQCTFTIAGAFFVGILIAPAVIHGANSILPHFGQPTVPIIPSLAAVLIAYAFGEGLGRLACISFGCCYGVSLRDATPVLQRLFMKRHFVFWGQMKKISYASGLEGHEVVPVQALTSIIYIATGLAATWFFLRGNFYVVFIATMAVTQGWRSFSEMLRADCRGQGRISAYQIMSAVAILCAAVLASLSSAAAPVVPNLAEGIARIWHPAVVISLQALWGIVFVMFGKSMVTGAEISFHLRHDRI